MHCNPLQAKQVSEIADGVTLHPDVNDDDDDDDDDDDHNDNDDDDEMTLDRRGDPHC